MLCDFRLFINLKLAKHVHLRQLEGLISWCSFRVLLGPLKGILVAIVKLDTVVDLLGQCVTGLIPDLGYAFISDVWFASIHHLIGNLHNKDRTYDVLEVCNSHHYSVTLFIPAPLTGMSRYSQCLSIYDWLKNTTETLFCLSLYHVWDHLFWYL